MDTNIERRMTPIMATTGLEAGVLLVFHFPFSSFSNAGGKERMSSAHMNWFLYSINQAPVKEHTPPQRCTTEDPAKSITPNLNRPTSFLKNRKPTPEHAQ